jgi:hypothetical protein
MKRTSVSSASNDRPSKKSNVRVYEASQFAIQDYDTTRRTRYVQIRTTDTGRLRERQTNQQPVPPPIDPDKEISEWIEEPRGEDASPPQPVLQKPKKRQTRLVRIPCD